MGWRCTRVVIVAASVYLWASFGYAENGRTGPAAICRGGSAWAHEVLRDASKALSKSDEHADEQLAGIDRWDDTRNIERLCDGDCQVLYHRFPTDDEAKLLKERFPNEYSRPQAFFVGQARVAVITRRSNAIERITLNQICDVLKVEGTGTKWPDMGGSGGVIRCYGEGRDATSRLVIRRACMMLGPEFPTGYHLYRDDFEQCADAGEVVRKVRVTNSIGFILYHGQPLHGVKFLAVAKTEDGPAVALREGPFIQKDYPLSEPLVLYLRPDASPAAKALCEFATGPEGAEIAAKHGLVTLRGQHQYLGNQRLTAMKRGKGTRLSAVAMRAGRSAMPDLAVEYVRARQVIRLYCVTGASDSSAIRRFLGVFSLNGESRHTAARELLLLDDKPSDKALEAYGEKWNELMPTEYLLAGRAVAIIVNRANNLESLTLDQVRAIFSSEVGDWAIIGGTGLSAPSGEKGARIKRLGLSGTDPAARVFHKQCLPSNQLRRVTLKKDTAEVVAAVSMDPQAIAFVDLAAIPTTGQTVKVLALQLGTGERAKVIQPTPGNIGNAMYPLSQRVYLYVHPKASDAARNFARFIATCGASEETPYADTVQAIMAVYEKHGLIPLADAAIERRFKDSVAAAKAANAR